MTGVQTCALPIYLCDNVIDVSGQAYPELEKRRVIIKKVVGAEELKFAATIDLGFRYLNKFFEHMRKRLLKVLDGEHAFKLHDTYGFPIELTREIAAEHGFTIDDGGFRRAMQEQKDRSRVGQEMEGAGWEEAASDCAVEGATEFTGYRNYAEDARIEAIASDLQMKDSANEGETCRFILNRTPFYAESGGQIYDTGYILGDDGSIAQVVEVRKEGDVFAHRVEIRKGSFKTGDAVSATIMTQRRNKIAANHSATHLLHKALQEVLGEQSS